MQVKLDFSEDCKTHGYALNRPGTYAIYIRKNFLHRWKQIQSYASVHVAMSNFRDLKEAADSMTI